MTSDRLRQNFNVVFFQCVLTAQMERKFKSSEPAAGHVTRKIGPLYFKQNGQPISTNRFNCLSEVLIELTIELRTYNFTIEQIKRGFS